MTDWEVRAVALRVMHERGDPDPDLLAAWGFDLSGDLGASVRAAHDVGVEHLDEILVSRGVPWTRPPGARRKA